VASFGIGPNLASYGSRGRSSSLAAFGQDQEQEATQELGAAAAMETQRNVANKQTETQRKQGNQALGSTLGGLAGGAAAGAMYGSSAGPWGTVIGGVLGAIAGNFF
jgi:predicted lipid-binding transport protein (Tim44 family)